MSETSFSRTLIEWYHENKRKLPWRETSDPYLIWLSEIILQQTSVNQGMPYFQKFVHTYPTIFLLAEASLDQVLKLWEGLGYYSRARNLHETAKYLVRNRRGQFPESYSELLELKGVGPYTAAAIASFAFNKPHAVVDGNVLRVISRFLGITEPVDTPPTKKMIFDFVQNQIESSDPYTFNQAVMEFGALQCVAKNPACEHCPFMVDCVALRNGLVGLIPYKSKSIKRKNRFFIIIHYRDSDGNTLIEQRKGADIWKGLYQFPTIEVDKRTFSAGFREEWVNGPTDYTVTTPTSYRQHLTHQTINSKIYQVILNKGVFLRKQEKQKLLAETELPKYAFPKTIGLYLNDISITLDK